MVNASKSLSYRKKRMKLRHRKFTEKFFNLLEHQRLNESIVLSIVALIVGVVSGAGVWFFKWLIDSFHLIAFDILSVLMDPAGRWTVALLPVIGGLIVGLIIHFFVGVERHHGVAGIMEAVALAGGRLNYLRMPAKALASALGIGFGASVGPEDPSVQIGANIGAMFGAVLHLTDDRVRSLVAAGSAAGIAAAFNAPIAGVFFALEIVLGEIGGNAFGVVVVAAVVSSVFTQAVSGPQPAFLVPVYPFHDAQELPLYMGLGLIAGPVAALYVRTLYLAQDFFHSWHAPLWLKPAAAGLIVGITGIFIPQIFGVGYDTIEETLATIQLAVGLMLLLTLAKMIMTSISIGGGFLGGVFAPALYLGATLGTAYGIVAARLFPSLSIAPPAFALVGMAAVLAGSVHAPLTAILLLFEMTNNYRIILPLMFAVTISMLISQRLQSDSVYTLGLARKGIRLERGRDVEVMQAITVGEVMQTDVMTLHDSTSLQQASDVLMRTRHHGLPVVNDFGELTGIITVQDIDRAHNAGKLDSTVGQVCTHELLYAYPDETIGAVLRRMSARDVGRLPVVERDDPHHLLGLLRRSDIIRAYDVALTRRAALRHRAHQVRLGAISGEMVSVNEMVVDSDAICVGKRISEVDWPHECVIATIRRGRQLIFPHGETVLKPGDVVVAVAEGEARDILQHICQDKYIPSPETSPTATFLEDKTS
jgi:CIC family chloride channel protein